MCSRKLRLIPLQIDLSGALQVRNSGGTVVKELDHPAEAMSLRLFISKQE